MRKKVNTTKHYELARALEGVGQRGGRGNLEVEDLLKAAEVADSKLDALAIRSRERRGARFVVAPGGVESKAYRHPITVTRATLERGSVAWFLIELERVEKWPGNRREEDLYLTRAQERSISAGLERRGAFKVQEAEDLEDFFPDESSVQGLRAILRNLEDRVEEESSKEEERKKKARERLELGVHELLAPEGLRTLDESNREVLLRVAAARRDGESPRGSWRDYFLREVQARTATALKTSISFLIQASTLQARAAVDGDEDAAKEATELERRALVLYEDARREERAAWNLLGTRLEEEWTDNNGCHVERRISFTKEGDLLDETWTELEQGVYLVYMDGKHLDRKVDFWTREETVYWTSGRVKEVRPIS